MTEQEQKHINRMLRVLNKATRDLALLNRHAQFRQIFPKTTEKTYVEILKVKSNTEIRIAARRADAI
jgi:hypothetical protein